ncbi:MAG: monomeric [Victivallales bacterium]|nr:monomeric [FeFe] hydrogenase [Victivallales bacterium]
MIDNSIHLRRELMIRFIRAFHNGVLEKELDQIPIKMRPKDGVSSRCCIYHDRAVIKYHLMNLLGVSCNEETDEAKLLAEYYREKAERQSASQAPASSDSEGNPCQHPLSVCEAACSECPGSRVVVTGNCRGCFSRPCMYACPQKAISVVDQKSTIDEDLCIKCGKCISACPFHAIVKTTVPCEEACPTSAIHKDDQGHTTIDYSKCIACGNCLAKCPFSAIMEKSQVLDVLLALKAGEKLVAVIAPSAAAQLPGTIEQLFTAVSRLGFYDVMEVALGAEETSRHEAAEFKERMAKGEKLMTTSCCSAYVEMVRKLLPSFLPHVSSTPSPMMFTAEIARREIPDCKVVFIGPCVAKRIEAQRKGVDFVLNFEELGAMLAGQGIDVISCEPWKLTRPAIPSARNYCRSCGVTKAVLEEAGDLPEGFQLDAKFIDGIDHKTLAMLKLYEAGKLPANFLEVMSCPGGCVNGPCSLRK